jgi:hypothetical protein
MIPGSDSVELDVPPRIGLVTCSNLPEADWDERLTLDALNSRFRTELIAWDAPDADPGAFDLLILRSTWNYHLHPAAFLEWCQKAAAQTRLLNPIEVVQWNAHKSYLLNLGVPVVPTHVVDERPQNLEALLEKNGWSEFVVKPAISGGSYKTSRFSSAHLDSAEALLEDILQEGDALIQPFIPSVEYGGEIAWTWIAGTVTHGIRKSPRMHDQDESVSAGFVPTREDLARLQPFLDCIPQDCLYARIDVMETPEGWLLSELELIEPSLFFCKHESALPVFVEAVARAANVQAPTTAPV